MPVSDSRMSREVARTSKYSGIKSKLDLFRFTQFHEPVKRWPFLMESVERQASSLPTKLLKCTPESCLPPVWFIRDTFIRDSQ